MIPNRIGPFVLTTSAQTVVAGSFVVSTLRIANNSGVLRTFSLSIGADSPSTRIYNAKVVDSSGYTIKGPFTLAITEFMQMIASGSGLTVTIDGYIQNAIEWSGDKFLSADWYIMDRLAGDTGDGSLGYYLPANVNVNGSGFLQIDVLHQSFGGRPYTSGALQWSNLSTLYGTYEARIQMSETDGLSPVWWLLGLNCEQTYKLFEDNSGICDWPNAGSDEVDLAEMLVGNSTHVNFQVHNAVGNEQIYYDAGVDVSLDFHTYKATWSPGRLETFFDGVSQGAITTDVPNTPMFMIIADAAGPLGAPVNNSLLPAKMLIDYVRFTPL